MECGINLIVENPELKTTALISFEVGASIFHKLLSVQTSDTGFETPLCQKYVDANLFLFPKSLVSTPLNP